MGRRIRTKSRHLVCPENRTTTKYLNVVEFQYLITSNFFILFP